MSADPFTQDGNWYRANFHSHTTESDGQTPVDQRIRQYRDGGYDILAVTDHNMVVDVAPRSTDEFLLINGSEIGSPGFRPGHRFHILCLNLPVDFDCQSPDEPNGLIARVNEVGGVAFLAHPYWSACNGQDMLALEGHAGIEVWCSSQWGGGHAVASVHWDIGLDAGLRFPAIATDDTHSPPGGGWDLCAGWTMLKMPELTVEAVMEALRTGCFYASTGPEIHDFRVEDGMAYAECSPARQVRFMGWGPRGLRVWNRDGSLMTEARAEVNEHWCWVRLEVEGPDGRCAWANPIYLSDKVGLF